MNYYIAFLFCVVFVLCFLQYLFYYTPEARIFQKIPGIYKYPVVGNLFSLLLDEVQVFALGRKMAKKYKKIYSLQAFHFRAVNILNPQDAEIILSNPNYIRKSALYRIVKPWLKEGLFSSPGQKWHERRKIITPAFHFNILRQFCKVFDETSTQLVEILKSRNSEASDIHPIITKYTLHTICETAMGTQIQEDFIFKEYLASIHKVAKHFVHRLTNIWMHNDFVFRLTPTYSKQNKELSILHHFTASVIQQRKRELQSGGGVQIISKKDIEDDVYMNSRKKKMALLDLLLSAEAEGKIDEAGIKEEVDTFMFAGHDTVAVILRYSLMTLANHKDVQDKIVKELDEIFEGTHREATIDDLRNMHYLGMCIKEILRLYPGGPMISRYPGEDVQLTDYLVPRGATILIHIFDLHRDPSIYPSPEDFIPERFTVENCAKRHPYAYIPFSSGPRNCIGQKFAMLELKSLISRILRNFVLEPITKPQDVIFCADVTLQTKSPIYVKFISRN